ncbi:MAG: Fe-S cluster assembly protein SufD [Cytophagales bacterium]|nr:Fe-S cluster assembly protein SufD [Cytophagales bacterium]
MSLLSAVNDYFPALENSQNGNIQSEVHNLRVQAINQLNKVGFPTVKDENWKYHTLSHIIDGNYSLGNTFQYNTHLKLPVTGSDICNLVILNGKYIPALSNAHSLPKGIKIDNLSDVIYSDIFQNYWKQYNHDTHSTDGFAHLSHALAMDGINITVTNEYDNSKTLIINHITDIPDILCVPRVYINAENDSRATITEWYDNVYKYQILSNTTTKIVLSEGADVRYQKIVNNTIANHIGTTQVYQTGKSNFDAVSVNIGGKMVRNNLNVMMEASYSTCHLHALSIAHDADTIDNHTVIDHKVPHCQSYQSYKAVADKSGTAIFNGKIFVRQDAQKTNAYQSSKNLILDTHAAAYSKPQLEIWADDVKCSHGSTTGQLDKDALFYFKARGIDEATAKQMLVNAFAQDIISKISNEYIANEVITLVQNKLS